MAGRPPLPESDDELREFLDDATVGLRVVSPEGRILWANRAELDLVGYAGNEYIGHHLDEFLVEPGAAADLLGRLSRAERVESYQARLRRKDGSIRHVLIDASALYRDGVFVHSRIATRDITAFLEKEQAARHGVEETSRLKDEFLALLSHELRSPLGAILVWLGLLQRDGLDPDERDRALGIIERSARTLERIIEDLLHASRIAAGGLMLIPQLVDLRSVVQVAVDAASGDAAMKGLELTWPPGEPIWVMGDPGRLQQAVSNLLSNAIKFTPPGGKVNVSLDRFDHNARLRVADTGEGHDALKLMIAVGAAADDAQRQIDLGGRPLGARSWHDFIRHPAWRWCRPRSSAADHPEGPTSASPGFCRDLPVPA